MKQVFAPGCALILYKTHLAEKVMAYLNRKSEIPEHLICCHHDPKLSEDTQVINICPGCDRRYRELYQGVTTVSLWEILAENDEFPFPDYNGKVMAVHDSCPTRTETRVHDAVRKLLLKMNINVIEPPLTKIKKSICCGDEFYGKIAKDKVLQQMKKRADQMPTEDVVVYCVSCVKSMFNGGKKPHYLVDLLFGEETVPGTLDPDAWHCEIDKFIESH